MTETEHVIPTKIVNVPYGVQNPYQNMMYSACKPEFILTSGKKMSFTEFAAPAFQTEHGCVHIHWDDRLFSLGDHATEDQKILFQQATESLRQYKINGGRILWTIHNRHAHSGTGVSESFREGRRQLAELVDIIHVHTPHAMQHMIDTYQADPEKMRLIPHPSYLGVYEDTLTTLDRAFPTRDKTRFLTFGTMRGSRELDKLHVAAAKLSRRDYDFHVHVAGKVFPASRRVIRGLQNIDAVTVTGTRIPNEDIPKVFAQAHAYILPSTQTFTSGTAMLALSFGLPIIAPDTAAHRGTTPESCHDLLYQPHHTKGLIRMIRHVIQMTDEELSERRQACFDFAQARAPHVISGQLKRVFEDMILTPADRKLSTNK
ncbi:glycosyltransferase family 4 protein [Ruegeria halocynthiae]|uniref:glycosyltransferase family 4 protein n=1 Tax=Ruegeria halocynthiae TaxID=985054 RepID=UPI00068C1E48|nr:glycosyltransferase family 4 protein [Ruegeria halocynthiae]